MATTPPGSVPQTRAIFDGQHSLKFGTPTTKFERLDGIVQAKTRNPHSQVLNPGTRPPGSVPQTRAIFDGQHRCMALDTLLRVNPKPLSSFHFKTR